MNYIFNKVTDGCAIPIRPCPFCGSEAQLVLAHDQVRRGIQCSACSACVPPVHRSEFEAMMRWNRRSGGVAAAGGRATRGISTAKKRRASRRNLALARQSKELTKVKTETEHSVSLLRAARQAEINEAQAAAAASRARLMDREAQILADPLLRQVYALLKRPQAVDDVGHAVHGG